MARWLGFVGPSYTAKSKIAAYDRSVNLFCERVESGTSAEAYTLYQANGVSSAQTGLDSPGRGGIANVSTITGPSSSAQNFFFVSGSTLYEYPSTVRATGIVKGSGAPVTMVWNGFQGHQILIASDSTTYCYDTTSHALTNVGIGMYVDFLQGYGLRLNSGDSTFSFSALFDMTSWDALDVVQRQDASDRWIRLIVHHKEVWLFGSNTTSVYYLGDDADTPFQQISSVFITMGIIAPDSACIVDGTLMWIGGNDAGQGVVYRADGYTPVRVSTHAVEYALQAGNAFGNLSTAEGCTYQQNGHVFYEITLPGIAPDEVGGVQGSTWVYDATEGLWHERGLYTGIGYQEMDTRGAFDGFTLSRSAGTVYSIVTDARSTSAFKSTDGTGIRWMRRAPHLSKENKGCIIDSVELKFQPGMASATGAGSDPHFTLTQSRNGGQTWSNARTVSAGLIGQFEKRALWDGLGYGRDRLIEIVGSDPIFTPIIDAYVDARFGRS